MIKKYKQFINESVVETTNVANQGDWIIKAKTTAGEEYVVKNTKFPKLYDIESAKTPADKKIAKQGFMEYNVIPEERTGLVCTREILKKIKSTIVNNNTGEASFNRSLGFSIKNPLTQEDMKDVVLNLKDSFIKCSKKSSAYAKQAKNETKVITKVEKGNPEEIWFVPIWGGTMPIAENDILIVNDKEVYRIARAEFNQTYNL